MNKYGFSDIDSRIMLAWDATRLSAYMRDPLSFKWKYIDGWITPRTNPALGWGTLWHESVARFDSVIFGGGPRWEALETAIDFAVDLGTQLGIPGDGIKGDSAKRNIRTV